MTVVEPQDEAQLLAELKSAPAPSLLYFYASFHAASLAGGKLDADFRALAARAASRARFVKIDAEALSEVAMGYGVEMVPCFVVLSKTGAKLAVVEGDDLDAAAEKLGVEPSAEAVSVPVSSHKIESLLSSSPVFLFMKGPKEKPFCKFSKSMVALLDAHKIEFKSFDVLEDPEMRNAIKEYTNWQTIPQLFVHGKFLGGLDIVQELVADDPTFFEELLGINTNNAVDLQSLINTDRVMLFMKGDRDAPRCGFSATAIKLLNQTNCEYTTFDILSNPEVREGLKTFSAWATYPQLYVNGELIGGVDIMSELADEGELVDAVNA